MVSRVLWSAFVLAALATMLLPAASFGFVSRAYYNTLWSVEDAKHDNFRLDLDGAKSPFFSYWGEDTRLTVDRNFDGNLLERRATSGFTVDQQFARRGVTMKVSAETIDFTPFHVATPIPKAAWLFGTGLVGLIVLRRRNRLQP